ncbi:sensor histidine kinase [Actinomadura algeriensis]|uniref:histidine kinase n=1 Tax=Actinomadura algeriensis TaxID=1679523 RepID=A0ABR9K4W1_9ACTN|nr:sensor histidine kinase [Actinomadura algeriensis]MBE1537861.1 signal transduction histidine kinase [Actinomadura algeriensis]
MVEEKTVDAPETLRTVLAGVRAAAVTGRADPAPLDRPWPAPLRWTRRIGIGRLPYGAVAGLFWLAITIALIAGTDSLLRTEGAAQAGYPGNGTALLIAVVVSVPLALRELHPLAAWRLGFVAMALIDVSSYMTVPYVPGGVFAMIMTLYTVAVRCQGLITLGAGLLSFAGVWIKDPETAPGGSVLLLLPLALGYAFRVRQTSRRELAEQERRHADAEAVLTERQRIARELHDVVAHHMSMIAIQAEAAPYKSDAVPDVTRQDLAEIRATALDALTELRRILGVLRSENGSETAPQPSLERLDELVAGARGAGLDVTARLTGDLADLPSGVGLTAYRILQEALSNAMRHAPGSRVDVEAARADGVLSISVVNGPPGDGRSPQRFATGGGHGLVGMRERAAMLGGWLTAEPTSEGGFAVTATLPEKAPENKTAAT